MSDRLTAEPGTLEFLKQLLEIAQASDHPMDKALAGLLERQITEREAVENDTLPEISDVIIGDEIVVVDDNYPVFIPIVSVEELVADTLNWFDENGDFCIGSKRNPEHVAAWREWNAKIEG